ncbi:MAG: DNRLRE domain-containing protein [Phycisphaerales bacterium]
MRMSTAAYGLLTGVAVIGGSARADLVTLNPVADNTLYYNETGDLSNGAGTSMFVGQTRQSGGVGGRRALVRFDIASAIPAGATITRTELTLSLSRGQGSSLTIGMHRLTNSWGESTSRAGDSSGGSGDLAAPGDATWIHRFASFSNPVFWNTPGGDFQSRASSTLAVPNSVGRHTWPSTTALVGDVQSFLETPNTNFGWILYAPLAGQGQARRFGTREAAADSRPVLTIEYTIPAPGSLALLAAGFAIRRRSR